MKKDKIVKPARLSEKEFREAFVKLVDFEPMGSGVYRYDYTERKHSKFEYKVFPKGHVTFLMLSRLVTSPDGMRRKDLIKYAFVKINGQELYDLKDYDEGRKNGMRGYWTGNFLAPGQYAANGAAMYRYCDRTNDGKYIINGAGLGYIHKYVNEKAFWVK